MNAVIKKVASQKRSGLASKALKAAAAKRVKPTPMMTHTVTKVPATMGRAAATAVHAPAGAAGSTKPTGGVTGVHPVPATVPTAGASATNWTSKFQQQAAAHQASQGNNPDGTPKAPTAAAKPPTPPTPPPVPVVKINENGQLDLPYGEAFGNDLLQHQQEMNSSLLDIQKQEQDQSLSYMQNKRDLGQQYTDIKRGTVNDNAARGTAFSSAYGVGVGKNTTTYNNMLNDLDSTNANAQANFKANKTGIEAGFNNYLRQAVLDRSNELSQDAGKLGYGTAKVPVRAMPKKPETPSEKATRIKKAKAAAAKANKNKHKNNHKPKPKPSAHHKPKPKPKAKKHIKINHATAHRRYLSKGK